MKKGKFHLVSFILAVVLLLSFAALPPAPAYAIAASKAVIASITVTNFADGEIINYDLPLLVGTYGGGNGISISVGKSTLDWKVWGGRWRAFVPLSEGENTILLTGSNGENASLKITYRSPKNLKLVRLVYALGSDSEGSFDAPIGAPHALGNAISRFRLAGRMLQSITAELLHEKGLPRRTFAFIRNENGDPVVDTPRSPLTVTQLRTMDPSSLYYHFYGLFGDLPDRENIIDIMIIADTHYDMATGQVLAHIALGGSRLCSFGSATFYSFPDLLVEVESHFLDSSPIESYLFPEYGRASQYWAAYTTSLGAILHEAGHCFGLPHPENPSAGDVMARGFDFLNRAVVPFEPVYGNIDPAVDIMPRWTDDDTATLTTNSWFSTASYSVYLPIVLRSY